LFRVLENYDVTPFISGTTRSKLTQQGASRIPIPLPPLSEQGRIAAILDQADAVRLKRNEALEKADATIEAVFRNMFDAPGTKWPEVPISDLATNIRTGPFGSQLLHSEFKESGIAVLGIDNAVQNKFVWARPRYINERKFQQLRRYAVHPGDVLITIMGTCGRCAVVPQDIPTAINTKHLCCISLDQARCLPAYLHSCFLMHPSVLRRLGIHERGAVMPGLNMQIIKELPIPLPPLHLQGKFSSLAVRLESGMELRRESFAKLNALFQSLQYRAFRGEL
ncbi:MAG: restriction endonuclease subunit S, partial [Acidobacteriaceae bacterium]|nr:restriction endonuclease subunit S [Acidobacteriaceae bacterium]